ncbi:MAG: hypothetical protein JW803_01085 [Endomicrobiales bacterium]|nr:hypothetical protein [Endomicrobiales bacterium]
MVKKETAVTVKKTDKLKGAGLLLIPAVVILFAKLSDLSFFDVKSDILFYVALLTLMGYMVQFPLSKESFAVQGWDEKFVYFVAIGMLNAMCVFVLPALAGYAFKLTMMQLLLFYLAGFVVFGLVREYAGVRPFETNRREKEKDDGIVNLLFWVMFAASVLIGVHYGCWLSGDYTWHGSAIRKLKELQHVYFGSYLVRDVHFPQYGHNIWYLFLAFLSFLTDKDTGYVWVNSQVFLVPFRVCVVYFLSKELFGTKYWAKVSTIVYLSVHFVLGFDVNGFTAKANNAWPLDVMAYPSVIARDFFIFAAVAYLLKTIREKKAYYVETFFLITCVTLTHFYYCFQYIYIYAALFIGSLLFPGGENAYFKKIFLKYGLLFVPAVLYAFFYKNALDVPTINPYFLNPEGMGDPLSRVKLLFGKYPYVHPWPGFLKNAFFAAILATLIPMALTLKKNAANWKLFIVSVPAGLALILFNPPLMFIMQKFNPGLDRIWRFDEIIPYALTLAGFIYFLQEEKKLYSKKAATWILVAYLIVLAPFVKVMHKDAVLNAKNWESTLDSQMPYKQLIESRVPRGSVVFPDPKIAWTWTTLFSHFIFIHPLPAGLPPNFDPMERLKIWNGFFEGKIDGEVLDYIDRYGVEYYILTADSYARLKNKLDRYKNRFQPPEVLGAVRLVVMRPAEKRENNEP